MKTKILTICAVSWVALVAAQAHAQDAVPVAAAPEQASADQGGISDIIVTANKRSESIDKVPLAIAAVTGDTLKQQGVNSVQDLSRLVPGLNVTSASYGTDVYTIRGVGFYDTTLAAVPAVSVYVDEVPLPYSVMASATSLDPERVEVLMGPQGTLFGQNSTGGAINYIAAKPSKDFAAGLTGTIGNYETYNLDGYVSGPISSTLGARLSFKSLNSDKGWQKSVTRNDRLGEIDQQQARLLLDWKPSDRLSFLLNINGFLDKSDTQAPRYLGYTLNIPALAFTVPELTGAQPTSGDIGNADWDPGRKYQKNNKFYQISLRGDYEIGDTLTLTNIAAYSHYKHDQLQDVDGLNFENINYRVLGKIKNFSEELRLSGNISDDIKFVLGGNYQKATVNQHQIGDVDIYTTSFAPVILAGLPRFRTFEDLSDQRVRSLAAFGNLDFDVTDTIGLHAGLRYTDSSTKLVGCSLGDASLTAIAGSTNPPGECLTLSPTFVSGAVRDELKEDNVSWRVGVDYKPRPGLLFYANISRGFKAGSYPVLAASTFQQLLPVRQEQLTSYEAGFKATLFDRTLRLNGAVFHYSYKDKQIRGRIQVPVFGGLETLLNIPKSELTGAELNAQWQPVPGLNINGGFSYIDSKIRNFTNFDVAAAAVDLDGASFPNAPSFRGTLSGQYDWALAGSLNAFAGVDYSHTSKTRGTLGFTPILEIPEFDLLGLQAGIHPADDRWRASLWVRNLTDKLYYAGTNRGGEALIGYVGMPRTFGATFTFNFK